VVGGCTSGPSRITIGVSVPSSQTDFFRAMLSGARAEAKKQGAVLLVANAGNDAARQAMGLDGFLDRGVDAIVLDAAPSPALLTATRDAREAEVPVIAVRDVVASEQATSSVVSANVVAGRLAAEYLFFRMGGTGQAAEVMGSNGGSSTVEVERGFRQIAKETGTVSMVARRTTDANRTDAAGVALDLFKDEPDLDGVFANSDEIALGVVQAARRLGILGRVAIIGVGGTRPALRAVKAEQLEGTIRDDARRLGRLAVGAAVRAAKGRPVPKTQIVDVTLVTHDNVNRFLS
jgi:ABC-type sugar transport system substrate-binding protein